MNIWAGVMGQRLETLAALSEIFNSFPSAHMVAHNHQQPQLQESYILPLLASVDTWLINGTQTYVQAKCPYIYKMNIIFKLTTGVKIMN